MTAQEEIEYLKEIIRLSNSKERSTSREIRDLKRDLKKFEEALSFYADPICHEGRLVDQSYDDEWGGEAPGAVARRALNIELPENIQNQRRIQILEEKLVKLRLKQLKLRPQSEEPLLRDDPVNMVDSKST